MKTMFAALAVFAFAVLPGAATAQEAERWTSADGVVSVELPPGWAQETSPNPSMKLYVTSEAGGFSGCSVVIDARNARPQASANALSQRFAQVQMATLQGATSTEARAGEIVVMSWMGQGRGGPELSRMALIGGDPQSTSYLIYCMVAPGADASYTQAERFAQSLTINGEIPQ